MGNQLENFSFKCQVDDCPKAIECYSPSVKKYFWDNCASNNKVAKNFKKVPNPLDVHKMISNSKPF